MNATQLEAIVVLSVDALRRGDGSEDDRVEFKREWPQGKARQLAAAANQAIGEDVIYVIGVDETDGSIHPTAEVDAADWWAQIESQFDEVAPELVRHLVVYVSETEAVTALLFRTDRPPYVVKANGSAEREVPIRSGSRTRSAHRHELLRLLYPSVRTPQAKFLEATVVLAADRYGASSDGVALELRCEVYYEQPEGEPVFLPRHDAYIEVRVGDRRASVELDWYLDSTASRVNSLIELADDGVRVKGSGTAHFLAAWRPAMAFAEAQEKALLLMLVQPAAGLVSAPVKASADLLPVIPASANSFNPAAIAAWQLDRAKDRRP